MKNFETEPLNKSECEQENVEMLNVNNLCGVEDFFSLPIACNVRNESL